MWNHRFQHSGYRRNLAHCSGPSSRLKALLYSTVDTQSQPPLDHLSPFVQFVEQRRWAPSSLTARGLASTLLGNQGVPGTQKQHGAWEGLFRALREQPGWGNKTAALFVSAVIKIHRSKAKRLHFLSDLESARGVDSSDRIYLPVDAVILKIFSRLSNGRYDSFPSINNYLLSLGYSPDDFLLWDDLWFWGFFTQHTQQGNDSFQWNEARYWCQRSSDKAKVNEVKELCGEFVRILK